MKIGIDARLWNETGVGRYIRALVRELGKLDTRNEYILFLKAQEYEALPVPNIRWHKYLADAPWHSITEQLLMPAIYKKSGVELVHIPYFSVPILTQVPFVVTIHDITISHYATGKATTKPKLIYFAKWLGYKFVLQQAIKKAEMIITVSETVKKQLLAEYKIPAGKIAVTYESGELETDSDIVKIARPKQYLLYVGNAHPHKNLEILLRAFKKLVQNFPNLHLVLIGPKDYFYNQLTHFAQKHDLNHNVLFISGITNASLKFFYKGAIALVFPSQSEGFGIPGLEAMTQGTPVAASDISVFHEIYGEAALYFDQTNPDSIVATLSALLQSPELKKKLVTFAQQKVKEYSWQKMAQETFALYENCTRLRSR